jgi:hypothetical protein
MLASRCRAASRASLAFSVGVADLDPHLAPDGCAPGKTRARRVRRRRVLTAAALDQGQRRDLPAVPKGNLCLCSGYRGIADVIDG